MTAVPAQLRGVDAALSAKAGGYKAFLIADQMGSGKTLQAILVAKTLLARGEIDNVVVLSKASLCSMWDERLRVSGIPTTWIKKTPQVGGACGQMLPSTSTATVTNYSLAIRKGCLDLLERFCWNRTMLILDESHAVKSTGWKPSKISQAVWGLGNGNRHGLANCAGFTLCLSGTPTPNGRNSELHGFLTVAAGMDRSYHWYANKFCGLEKQQVSLDREAWVETRNTCMAEWKRIMNDRCIRRPVSAFADLPPLTYTDHYVRPPTEVRKADGEMADVEAEVMAAINAGTQPAFEEFATVMRLIGKAKVPAAADLIRTLTEDGEPLVVFVRHRDVMDGIEGQLYEMKITAVVMSAKHTGAERGELVERFQSGGGQVFLTSIGIASEGITLTRASQSLMTEQDFTPGRMSQAASRIHRMGQDRHCTVHRLTMEDTIDERLARLLQRKSNSIKRQENERT